MVNRYNVVVEYKKDGLYQLTTKLMNVPNEVKIMEMFDDPKKEVGSFIVESHLTPHAFTMWLDTLDIANLDLTFWVLPQFHAKFNYEKN